jgi:hypothetical protein
VLDLVRANVKNVHVFDALIQDCLDANTDGPEVKASPHVATTQCALCNLRKPCREHLIVHGTEHRIASDCARLARAAIEFYEMLYVRATQSRSTIDRGAIEELDRLCAEVAEGHAAKRRRK